MVSQGGLITNRLFGQKPRGSASASPEARRRCDELGRVWPVYWHEDEALLWSKTDSGEWVFRLPEVSEAERLLGLPSDFTAVPQSPDKKSVKVATRDRWRMIANAWHVPCLCVIALSIAFAAQAHVSAADAV